MRKSVKITGYEDVQPDNEDALTCAVAQQPVSVAINAGTRDFQLYSGVSKCDILLVLNKTTVVV